MYYIIFYFFMILFYHIILFYSVFSFILYFLLFHIYYIFFYIMFFMILYFIFITYYTIIYFIFYFTILYLYICLFMCVSIYLSPLCFFKTCPFYAKVKTLLQKLLCRQGPVVLQLVQLWSVLSRLGQQNSSSAKGLPEIPYLETQ